MATRKTRLVWVDFTRAVAIVMVCLTHMTGIIQLGQANRIFDCCVCVLLLVSGYVTHRSTHKKDLKSSYCSVIKRFVEILILYVITTVIYIFYHNRTVNWFLLWNHIKLFDASGPLYYFAFYLQYILIGPILSRIVSLCGRRKKASLAHGLCFLAILIIATLSTLYTNLGGIFGGGNMVLGGTLFILFYGGMVLQDMEDRLQKVCHNLAVRIVLTALTLIWVYLYVVDILPFDRWLQPLWGRGGNPPGLEQMVYGLLVVLSLMAWFGRCEDNLYLLKPILWIGQNTLFIFMYHMLVLDILMDRSFFEDRCHLAWVKITLFFTVIVGCAFMETIYKAVKKKIVR